MSFQSLGLSKPILKGIAEAGYDNPTDIQNEAIPIALAGKNLIGLGETGSGKTAAFGLPMLDRLVDGKPGLRAVILVPTRELCVQVAEKLRNYAAHTELHVQTAFGGIPIMIQEAAFRRGLDVLVACPGRLIDHIHSGNVDLDKVECLVLDEADRMLDMGFIPQIQKILSVLPDKRQNCLFSATMLPEIERLVKNYIGEAERVQIGKLSRSASTISHRFEQCQASDKERVLEKLLRGIDGRVLIFVKRKTRAEALGRDLKRAGLPADSIHGDKSAESRHVVLKAFERGKVRFMVATDVAARGIDVSDIRLVVNFDMPMALEDYIHRTGRTGRAGGKGEALSLITRLDKRLLDQILEHIRTSSETAANVIVDGKQISGGKQASGEKRERSDERGHERGHERDERPQRRDREDSDRERGRGRDERQDSDRSSKGRGRGRRDERDAGRSRSRSGNGRGDGGKRVDDRGDRDDRSRTHDRSERKPAPKKPVADVKSKTVRLAKKVRSGRDDASDLSW